MKVKKVVLFGAESSGKSSLLGRFLFPDVTPQVEPTVGAGYGSKTYSDADLKLEFWDTAGAERYQSMVPMYMRGSHIGIYCVDLTKPFDKNKIEKDIALFTETAIEEAAIILVATKYDSDEKNEDTLNAFNALAMDERFAHAAIVSSKNPKDPAVLLTQICEIVAKHYVSEVFHNSETSPLYINAIDEAIKLSLSDNLLHTALVNLEKKMRPLSDDKYRSIGEEARTLMQGLNKETDSKQLTQIIDDFENNCKKHLAGSHPRLKAVLKAVAVVAIAAVVTIVAALTGFGIGFAAGAWTGPAAFISAVAGASTAVGLAVGALGAIGLFKASPVEKAVHEVAKTAQHKVSKPE